MEFVQLNPGESAAANQHMIRDWREDPCAQFVLYVSQLLMEEAGAGAPEAATRR